MSDEEFDDFLRRVDQHDQPTVPDRFDEIAERARRARARAAWRRYFAGRYRFGYPPPEARPDDGLGGCRGTLYAVVLVLVAVGVVAAVWRWWP